MTRKRRQQGKVQYWALIVSVAAHSAALAVFAEVQLSGRAEDSVSPKSAINVQMIERVVVSEPTPRPKPRVEPIVPPEPEQPPLVSEPNPPEPPQPVAADSQPESDAPPAGEPVMQPPDEVEFFGQKSIVSRVCYVVDCSGSMYGRMYQVKGQLKQSILNLNSRQVFCVVFFMEGKKIVTTGGGTLTPATAQAKSRALGLIESICPCGATDAAHALETAMQIEDAGGEGPEAVYFLTDGFDLDAADSRRFVEKVRRLRNTHARSAVLHTIGFDAQPQDRRMLGQLAQKTGGAYINVN